MTVQQLRERKWLIITVGILVVTLAALWHFHAVDRASLYINRAIWATQGYDSYTYEYREICFWCFEREWKKAVVIDGKAVEGSTVGELHDQAQGSINDSPPILNINYDWWKGYPTVIETDLTDQTDGGYRFEARNLKRLLDAGE